MAGERGRADEPRATAPSRYIDAPSSTRWYLIVSGGDDQLTSRVVPLPDHAELVCGRKAEADLMIDSESVSRRHARITRRGDQITVEDLGSRNGTLVNGTSLTAPRRVTAGDVIQVGPASAIVAASTPSKQRRQVATTTELEDRLAAEVDRAVRYHRPLGIVMLRIDGPVELMTEHVETLIGSLRRMDLVAEYGAEELALILPETDQVATHAVARRAKSVPVGLTATAGMATFPEDGSHVGELIGVARDRLRGMDRSATPIAPTWQPVVVDPLMLQVMALAKRVAPSTMPVLIVGETGVGKEVVADAIHRLSPRRAGPFVRLSGASLSEGQAATASPGCFDAASGGTLFLDEIGELPLGAQAELLRVLEQRGLAREGGSREAVTEVRLVCATNRDLVAEVSRGRFREDLYFRLSGFVIPVPPLRDRRAEIEPLAQLFVRELIPHGTPAIGREALDVLEAYDWPGNVRELRNAIERALVLSGRARIDPHHLPERMLERLAPSPTTGPAIDVRQRVADVEREAVIDALEATNGNQTKAAKKLGVSRFALIRMMDKHDLKRPR